MTDVLLAAVALAAGTGAVLVRRRPDVPRRRLVLTGLWSLALVAAVVALQGVVMLTWGSLMVVLGIALAARGGLREPGGRFTGRGVAVVLLLGSGVLLLAFAVGVAVDPGSPGRYTPASAPPTRGLEAP